MKHKHYDKIVAKAANMDLVVFYKLPCEEWWQPDSECEALPDEVEIDYFLCLPPHKEACLHWLNDGKSQVEYTQASYPYWCDIDSDEANWSDGHIFMDNNLNIRIKPKKEKRWIGVNSHGFSTPMTFISENECDSYVSVSYQPSSVVAWQYIEIEVEV